MMVETEQEFHVPVPPSKYFWLPLQPSKIVLALDFSSGFITLFETAMLGTEQDIGLLFMHTLASAFFSQMSN